MCPDSLLAVTVFDLQGLLYKSIDVLRLPVPDTWCLRMLSLTNWKCSALRHSYWNMCQSLAHFTLDIWYMTGNYTCIYIYINTRKATIAACNDQLQILVKQLWVCLSTCNGRACEICGWRPATQKLCSVIWCKYVDTQNDLLIWTAPRHSRTHMKFTKKLFALNKIQITHGTVAPFASELPLSSRYCTYVAGHNKISQNQPTTSSARPRSVVHKTQLHTVFCLGVYRICLTRLSFSWCWLLAQTALPCSPQTAPSTICLNLVALFTWR